MLKFFGFFMLLNLVGNPFLALIILLVILYFLDRRYVGIFPSITKPFRRSRQISKLRTTISLNPNDVSAKFDLARLMTERKRFSESKELLVQIADRYEQSAEYWVELGYVNLKLGQLPEGKRKCFKDWKSTAERNMGSLISVSPRLSAISTTTKLFIM